MNQITFTKPVALYIREDGLTAFQYELKGLVAAVCTTFFKDISEAIENAKENIHKYLVRVAEYMRITKKEKESLGLPPENKIIGWEGIKFNQDTARWDMEITVNGEIIHTGNYKHKYIEAKAKRTANLKYGNPEYMGKINNDVQK